MALQPNLGPWPIFSVSWSYTQSVGLIGCGISPTKGLYLHTGLYNHRINAYVVPRLGFEHTISVFEREREPPCSSETACRSVEVNIKAISDVSDIIKKTVMD
jgi:hypothetical protein